jgi:hypothetical protein
VLFDFGSPEGTGIDAEITDAEVTSLGGGVHRVLPTGFTAEGELDEGTVSFELDDGCATFEFTSSEDPDEDVDFESCAGEGFAESLSDDLADAFEDVEVPPELDELVEAFSPVEVGIITVEHDGEHFVSWLRTFVDVVAVSFRGLERDDLEPGGIVFELLTGELDDEFEELFDAMFEDLGIDEEFEGEFGPIDDEFTLPPLDPTGTVGSGPDGELQLGDVIPGSIAIGEVAEFRLIGDQFGFFIGAQATDGADLTITVTDVVTGEELGFDDDTFGRDPEVSLELADGQVVVVTVAAFADCCAGEFVVYYE